MKLSKGTIKVSFVLWFVGKSGAGKTTIGKKLFTELKKNLSIIYLDGDELREAISWDLSHSPEDREISEKRRSRLSKLISRQNISVICAGISNSPEVRNWNRKNINNYLEIYLKVDKKSLYKRDRKGIYKKFIKNEINNVVGEDIFFYEPKDPWLVFDNNNENSISIIVDKILDELKRKNLV